MKRECKWYGIRLWKRNDKQFVEKKWYRRNGWKRKCIKGLKKDLVIEMEF